MKPAISLLLPTRQRPDQLVRLHNSVMATAAKPRAIELVVYIDEDDDSYDKIKLPRLTKVRGPRIILSEMWNECWKKAKGDYFMHAGDDLVFKTQAWDYAFIDAIDARPGNICFAWANDVSPESNRHEFGTHGMVHRNWTNVVGRFVPPYFASDYNDTWFNDVGRALNVNTYLHHIITEHMHYSLGKAEMDQNTKDRLKRHEQTKPEEIYNSPEKKAEREAEIERLREFINDSREIEYA